MSERYILLIGDMDDITDEERWRICSSCLFMKVR